MNESLLTSRETIVGFYIAECEGVHALCDRAQVPMDIDGERLTMCQRVTYLERAYQQLIRRIGADPLTIFH